MVADKIIFNCSACNTRLTVPATMAGVEGPCPTCGATIRAPRTGTQIPAAKAPAGPPLPVTTPGLRAPLPPMPPPVDPALLNGPRIRPEPREPFGRPAETRSPLITPRKTTDDEGLRRNPTKGQRVRRPRGLVYRLLVPAGALALAGLVVFVILQSSGRGGKAGKKDYSYPEVQEAAPPRKKPKPAPVQPAAILPASESITPLQTPAAANTPDLPDAPAPAPILISPLSDRLAAEKVLEQFLQAEDAGARVALSEPATDASALANGPLAGAINIDKVEPEEPRTNVVLGFTEFPFYVDVKQKDHAVPVQYTMIVRKHGDQSPKVFLPPVTDLLGGDLASYAEKPRKEYGTFHVVLNPVAGCFEDVPNSEAKYTLKLMPGPFSKEIAKCYISKTSRFTKILDDPNSPLRWGVKLRVKVTVRWNFIEDPSNPYLELIEIKSFNWDA